MRPGVDHVRASLEARGVRARHLHGRGPRALGALLVVYAPDACIAVECRMAVATAFLRASSELASLSRKVMNELRRSLGAKATPACRLSTACTTSV